MPKHHKISKSKEKWVLDTHSERFSHVPFYASSHYDERPAGVIIDLLVIHNISLPPGKFDTPQHIIDFFMGRLDTKLDPYFEEIAHLRVASHLVIFRDGTAAQFVPFSKRAWHAGQSTFQGRTACNDFSIGIELEGSDDLPYTDAQYEQLIQATKAIQLAYPAITSEHIQGHSDIAPNRKTDPGPCFDWERYKNKLLD